MSGVVGNDTYFADDAAIGDRDHRTSSTGATATTPSTARWALAATKQTG
jgi:hypothetical protein